MPDYSIFQQDLPIVLDIKGMTKNKNRRWITLASFLATFHLLLAYGLPAGIWLILAIAAGFLYHRVGAIGSVVVTFSLIVITLFYSLALRITGFEDAIYYRPDERLFAFSYAHNHRIFKPGTTMEMQMPHGDLQSMTTEKISSPHHVTYRIDSYGFRNDADYRGQKYLLVGDSFIAGSGNTQADLLNTQLARDHGVDTYNLAHPGDVPDYAMYVAGFRAMHGNDAKVLLFVFEGNDFVDSRAKQRSAISLFFKRYTNMFSDTNVFRVTKSLYKRATRSSGIAASEYITLAGIQGKKVAFLTGYVNQTRKTSQPVIPAFERAIMDISPGLEHVYFIPTKYRVYRHYVNPNESLPNVAWEYLNGLCAKKGLRCTNLTEPLVQASDELLKKGELTWWPDDTHWNGNGIAVAARVVASTLAAQPGGKAAGRR
jgi:hypothetical protein